MKENPFIKRFKSLEEISEYLQESTAKTADSFEDLFKVDEKVISGKTLLDNDNIFDPPKFEDDFQLFDIPAVKNENGIESNKEFDLFKNSEMNTLNADDDAVVLADTTTENKDSKNMDLFTNVEMKNKDDNVADIDAGFEFLNQKDIDSKSGETEFSIDFSENEKDVTHRESIVGFDNILTDRDNAFIMHSDIALKDRNNTASSENNITLRDKNDEYSDSIFDTGFRMDSHIENEQNKFDINDMNDFKYDDKNEISQLRFLERTDRDDVSSASIVNWKSELYNKDIDNLNNSFSKEEIGSLPDLPAVNNLDFKNNANNSNNDSFGTGRMNTGTQSKTDKIKIEGTLRIIDGDKAEIHGESIV